MILKSLQLGRVPYDQAYRIQHTLLRKRQESEIDDTLVLLEHPPVITHGRRGRDTDILLQSELLEKQGVQVHEIERGGETTYHGPGQIVGYMFISLQNHKNNVKNFVHNIEQVFINLLDQEYSIEAGRDPDYIGVWVGKKKITAIGIAIKRKITMHGFAFNVNTNLDHFKWIIPCGITDKGVTSLQELVGRRLDQKNVEKQVMRHFCSVFGYQEEPVVPSHIEQYISDSKEEA
jgi:lipoyl(octanoyl) transferase